MARMSKITRIIYLTDKIIGSRQPTGRINRIIKVVADRNVNRVTVFSRAVIVRGNINQDLVNINAADFLVSVAGMFREELREFRLLRVSLHGWSGHRW